jgi:hypothetical protein
MRGAQLELGAPRELSKITSESAAILASATRQEFSPVTPSKGILAAPQGED